MQQYDQINLGNARVYSGIYFQWGCEEYFWNGYNTSTLPKHTLVIVNFNKLVPVKRRSNGFLQLATAFTRLMASDAE